MHEPPQTPRREVVDTLHGEEVTDPYRWLEAESAEVSEWVERQNAYAESMLDVPARRVLEARFDELARVTDYEAVRPAAGRYFQRVKAHDDEQPVLCVRDSLDGDRRTLVDPNEWSDDGTVSMDWFVPHPDGEFLAYGVATGGDEQYDVRIIDVVSGDLVDELVGVGRISATGFAWTADGFYYVSTGTREGDGVRQLDKEIRHHVLGSPSDTDALVVDDFEEQVWPVLETDDDVLVVQYYEGWDRSEVYALDETPDAGRTEPVDLVPVVTEFDATFEPTLRDGYLYLLTDFDAPRSRLLGCDVETALSGDAHPDEMDVVVPEHKEILRDIALGDDRIVAHYHRNAHSALSTFTRDGERVGRIDLPEYAAVAGTYAWNGELFYTVESFERPPRVCCADLETEETRTLDEPEVGIEADLEVKQEWFESADGTRIPAFVVHRSDLDLDGDNPTVLTGYGGFRVNRTPTFNRFAVPFLEAGGVYVSATLRGGAEFGEQWHEAGRRGNKQNVFDDATAVAEGLVERRYTNPDRLAVSGGSNGGLLVGALITQRPDLFGAALCLVPLLDMLRFHNFLLGPSWTTEYGSPDDPVDYEYIRAYSPYHNVERTEYPATLFTTAAGDTRVHPSHARKMTARLQAANTGDEPVLLRTEEKAGHGLGKPTSMYVTEQAEQWGFLCRSLGLDADDLRSTERPPSA
ncbi:prolyl oligopeptidase family protein [Haloprofundus sp. MHR1]|uniref:prolyl oligopeptidase family serine peptidase n=1 Tax=Haloprofundus sp. MHR1 TaxID=2572921 RepID=UPI0010BE6723|nr:prolyl oligopeptidase family serine peptidase [Haloprofundus sp. MHR1]QCJ46183.1 S9 family peptidase [Haloprofundus sp. MHR1]